MKLTKLFFVLFMIAIGFMAHSANHIKPMVNRKSPPVDTGLLREAFSARLRDDSIFRVPWFKIHEDNDGVTVWIPFGDATYSFRTSKFGINDVLGDFLAPFMYDANVAHALGIHFEADGALDAYKFSYPAPENLIQRIDALSEKVRKNTGTGLAVRFYSDPVESTSQYVDLFTDKAALPISKIRRSSLHTNEEHVTFFHDINNHLVLDAPHSIVRFFRKAFTLIRIAKKSVLTDERWNSLSTEDRQVFEILLTETSGLLLDNIFVSNVPTLQQDRNDFDGAMSEAKTWYIPARFGFFVGLVMGIGFNNNISEKTGDFALSESFSMYELTPLNFLERWLKHLKGSKRPDRSAFVSKFFDVYNSRGISLDSKTPVGAIEIFLEHLMNFKLNGGGSPSDVLISPKDEGGSPVAALQREILGQRKNIQAAQELTEGK